MSLSRRSIKKVTKADLERLKLGKVYRSLECACGRIVENVGHDIGTVTCAYCVQGQCAPPANYVKALEEKNKEKHPRGWQFMKEYISPSGKIYHKGRLVDESTSSDE